MLGVEAIPVNVRGSEFNRVITEFARAPNGGLIMTAGYGFNSAEQRDLMALAANHRLPRWRGDVDLCTLAVCGEKTGLSCLDAFEGGA